LIHFLCIKKNNIHQIKFDAHEDQKQRMRKFVFMNFSIGHKAECECEKERERGEIRKIYLSIKRLIERVPNASLKEINGTLLWRYRNFIFKTPN
jgi:hypothetical protein